MMALGVDPTTFLTTDDRMLRNVLIKSTVQALEIKKKFDENLSIMIANNVGKLFG